MSRNITREVTREAGLAAMRTGYDLKVSFTESGRGLIAGASDTINTFISAWEAETSWEMTPDGNPFQDILMFLLHGPGD